MLLHTDAFTHITLYAQTLLHRCFYTQMLPHTEAFTQRHFYTHTLLHADPFTHRRFYTQTLLRANPFTHKSFHPSFSHSTIISCERVARKLAKLQFYYTFGNQNVYESEQSAANAMLPCKKNHFTSVLDGRTSFRAKGLRRTRENRNFASVFDDRTSFRAKGLSRHTQNRNFTSQFLAIEPRFASFRATGLSRHTQSRNFTSAFGDRSSFRAKGCRGTLKIAISHQFLAIEARFMRKCCDRHSKSQFHISFWRSNLVSCAMVAAEVVKSQFYLSFWRSKLVSCERVAFRAVSLALSRALREK